MADTSLLIIDDDGVLRSQLVRAFTRRGYPVRAAATGVEALALATEESPEWAILDLRLPDMSGLEVLAGLLKIDASTRVVLLTGYGSIASAVDAMRIGAANYVPKPADVDDILAAFAPDRLDGTTANYEAPSLARTEWEHINRVLADCGGNISEAARRLGIHRRSLQRKLQKHPPVN